jgi:outer membrane protein
MTIHLTSARLALWRHRAVRVARLLGPLAALAAPLRAQPARTDRPALRLAEVLRAVDRDGYASAAARADADAARADVTATLPGLLPRLQVEGGTIRTTDPIGVFGARLRQRAVTQADFDPARLNRPDALTLTTGALVLEQPLLAPQALLGRRAAGLAAEAATAMADRTTEQARLGAARAYYGAVVAVASVATLDSAVSAGRAHVRQATTLERNGVVTRSDMLLAQVRVGELEARRASAAGQATIARLGLSVQMGAPGDTTGTLPSVLPSTVEIAALVNAGWPHASGVDARRDVQAAQLGERAARADIARTNGSWLPTVGAVARTDWAAVNQPFAGAPYWTVGVMASWSVFRGGGDVADRQRATARARAAASRADGAAAQAELEATQARIERDVALERLRIADRSLEQAREALRLVQRRYDGGLAAITELLDAAAARTAADLATVAARHDALVALAAERVALGLDLTPLLALDR